MTLYCFENNKICPSQEILIFAESEKEAWKILNEKSLEFLKNGSEEISLSDGATLRKDDAFDINKGLVYYRDVN